MSERQFHAIYLRDEYCRYGFVECCAVLHYVSNKMCKYFLKFTMLIVAPTGSMKRVTRRSIFKFSSRHRNVTGRVAALRNETL